jgi:ADP-ribose pyrophosphatase YjhB (NUDIX family)
LNPVPSVAAVLEQGGRVLLVKRGVEPGLGMWGLPGGFIEMGETISEAVVREVEEETGLRCKPIRIIDSQSVLGGYYGDLVVTCFAAEIVSGALKAGEDAVDAQFFDPANLPELAFEVHLQFLEIVVGRKLSPTYA